LRIEARSAIEKLRVWLATQGVVFQLGQHVQEVISGAVFTDGQWLKAERIVVCPGPDMRSLFPEAFSENNTQLCQLQMLRVQPPPGYRLGAGVMSDLSLVRYRGYSELPGSQLLLDQLRVEAPRELAHGIHLRAGLGVGQNKKGANRIFQVAQVDYRGIFGFQVG
jgi:glycine/D-amino acid oxidase-like deaminating enzyme